MGRGLTVGCGVAVVTTATYLALLGWDQRQTHGPDGNPHGPYDAWQVLVLVLALGAAAAWAGRRGHVMVAAWAAAFALTVCFSVDAATDPSGQDDGLWPVGALFVFVGTLLGFFVVGGIAARTSRRLRRPTPTRHADSVAGWVTVSEQIVDRGLATGACQALLDVVRPRAATAVVDAYSDHRRAMPPETKAAEEALREIGGRQHKGDPGMNIQLDLSSAEQWELLVHYAPWSINVDLCEGAETIATLHDCGRSISARLSPDEAARLSARLAPNLHIEPLESQAET